MRKIVYILCFIIVGYSSNAQTIFIERTDVDSSRSSFVTATYNFSFKVKVDGVSNCTSISFVLRYNQTEHVHFSNFRTLPFSQNGSVFVFPWYNPVDGFERIYTGILNGDTIGGQGANNPEAIEFEFTVSPNAPFNNILELYFEDAEAVVSDSGIGKIIKLKSNPILLNIHGFVEVWPGDANNDGIVNINDVSTVALYLGYGPTKPNFRTFQRLNPSTNWFGQTSLAWDSLAVTYADCDGDGEVTINDMLVIPLNFGKTHQLKSLGPCENDQNESSLIQNIAKIPFTIKANEPVIGFVGEIGSEEYFNPVSKFDLEMQTPTTFCTTTKKQFGNYVVCGSTNGSVLNNQLVCFSNGNFPITGKAITPEGKIVDAELSPLQILSSNVENSTSLFLENIQFPAKLRIVNILGETIILEEIYSKREIFSTLENLPNGIYFIHIFDKQKNSFYNLIK
ncbi:hypothetical protein D9V84_06840 [Bacteroidetes/Chlorobi group bacterium Naka2016]|jgi:hypothetical protein|nr:MAG: hypothetical protein D9V84_06840 [Bacteroidetes/Chlorobi group bacterium Naka2016]